MASRREAFGEVIAFCRLPDSPPKSKEDSYRWGVKALQVVVSGFHESTFSLRVEPDPKKEGINRVRISMRVGIAKICYLLQHDGRSRKAKVLRIIEE